MSEAASRLRLFVDEFRARRTDDTINSIMHEGYVMLALQASDIEAVLAENAFLKSFLQVWSPKMDGQHFWRFRNGWPVTEMAGPNVDEAVANGMKALEQPTDDQ